MNSIIDFVLNHFVLLFILSHVLMLIFWFVFKPGFWIIFWLLTIYFVFIFFYSAEYLSWQIYTDPGAFLVDPFTLFNLILGTILFYSFIYVFGVPMNPEAKPFEVSFTETFIWISFIIILFIDFFYYVLGVDSISYLNSDINYINYHIKDFAKSLGINMSPSTYSPTSTPTKKPTSFWDRFTNYVTNIFSGNKAAVSPSAIPVTVTDALKTTAAPTDEANKPPSSVTTLFSTSVSPKAAPSSMPNRLFSQLLGLPPTATVSPPVSGLTTNTDSNLYNKNSSPGASLGASPGASLGASPGASPIFSTPSSQTPGLTIGSNGIQQPVININIPSASPFSNQVNDMLGFNPRPVANNIARTAESLANVANMVSTAPGFSDSVRTFGTNISSKLNNFNDMMDNSNKLVQQQQQQYDILQQLLQQQQQSTSQSQYNDLQQQIQILQQQIKDQQDLIQKQIQKKEQREQSAYDKNAIENAPSGALKEVFHVSENKYTFKEAKALCRALGAKLATYEQIEDAYKNGADWFNYGWSEGQYAYFPLQVNTWKKIQEEIEGGEKSCGNNVMGKLRPGIAGGYFANPNLRFGVNCYGVKPPKRNIDQMAKPHIPKSALDAGMEKKIEYYKSHQDQIRIDSFNSNEWSEY